jgi:aspartokinase-like uncharacterized kinase
MMAAGRGRFRWDALIKIGGSLGRGTALRSLLSRLARLSPRRRLILVPGGGVFADLVRRESVRLRLPEDVAHRMALRGMDQYGLLIASLCTRARAVETLDSAERAARCGKIPVFLAASFVEREPGLEKTFRLTSDSIAAFLAGRVGAASLVLLKSVAVSGGRIRNRAEADAIAHRGLVDPLFPRFLPGGISTWILDGREPDALERVFRAQVERGGRGAAASPRSARRNATRRSGSRTP